MLKTLHYAPFYQQLATAFHSIEVVEFTALRYCCHHHFASIPVSDSTSILVFIPTLATYSKLMMPASYKLLLVYLLP